MRKWIRSVARDFRRGGLASDGPTTLFCSLPTPGKKSSWIRGDTAYQSIAPLKMHIPGRTFVISGGCSGLGRACAQLLHKLGGSVAILDLDVAKGEELIQELELGQNGQKGRAKFFEADVSETEGIERAVSDIADWVKQTGHEIGGVVPAAGVGVPGKVSEIILLGSTAST